MYREFLDVPAEAWVQGGVVVIGGKGISDYVLFATTDEPVVKQMRAIRRAQDSGHEPSVDDVDTVIQWLEAQG